MFIAKFMPFVALACFVLNGCQRTHDHDHDHGHDHGGHEGHSHAPSEDDPISATVFTDKIELFVEYPHLVQGQPAKFLAHFTVLDTGEPVSVGSLAFEASGPENTSISVKLDAPKRDGLFTPEVTFDQPGTYKARLVVQSPLVEDVVDLGDLVVHPNPASAHKAAQAAAGEDPPGAIPFLLEQQWKIKMLSVSVGKRTLVKRLTLPGQIVAAQGASAVISPPIAGRLLPPPNARIPRVGDTVQAEQILAQIEPPLPVTEAVQLSANQAQVGTLQTELALRSFELKSKELEVQREIANAKARLELAQRRYERIENLRPSGAASENQLEDAELNLSTAKLAFESAQALQQLYADSLKNLSHQQAQSRPALTQDTDQFQMPLRTPISGVVVTADHIEGEHLDAHEEVFRIVNSDQVWVVAHISEFDLGQIQQTPKAILAVAAYPKKSIDILEQGGRLVNIGTVIDHESRTLPIRYELPNRDGLLRIGMVSEVKIETDKSVDVLAIPEEAVVMENGRPTVYVLLEGETFQKRDLVLGIADNGYVEVRSGLQEGERVVTRGAYEIKLASLSPASFGHGHAH